MSQRKSTVSAVLLLAIGIVVGVVGAAILLVLVAAFPIWGVSTSITSPPTRVITIIQEPQEEEWSGIGAPAPDFTAYDLNGEAVTLSALRGHPVALNFWATWCGPCREEIPVLERAISEYAEAGLIVLAIDVGESTEKVREFVDQQDMDLTVLLDPDGAISALYEVWSYPTTVWIDQDGVVTAVHLGNLYNVLVDSYMADLLGQ
jgi:thiol-disulfide isomerase/thioredoxin